MSEHANDRGDGSAATDRAIANAMYALNPNQGEPVDASAALMWLRTTLPIEHPNFLTWQYVEATLGWSYGLVPLKFVGRARGWPRSR